MLIIIIIIIIITGFNVRYTRVRQLFMTLHVRVVNSPVEVRLELTMAGLSDGLTLTRRRIDG